MDGDGVIQTLDKLYFNDADTFNLDHLTKELPVNLTSDYILDYKGKLEKVLTIVTRKVSELILSHQPTYVEELQRIADLQGSITESIRVCTLGRSYLRYIKDGTAKNGSTIVENYKKRQSLAKLLDNLTAISELKRSVVEIRGLIDGQEDFPRAIQMCKDGKSLLASFQEYKCVNELGSKLNDTIELIGEQVDTVLYKMCLAFSSSVYAKLQMSYVLMDRSEIAVDQLLMHFCSAINSQSHSIVMKHIELGTTSQPSQSTATDSDIPHEQPNTPVKIRGDFRDLCNMITSEQYVHCLVELCTTFWLIMLNYRRILIWHKVDIESKAPESHNDSADQIDTLLNESSTNCDDKEEFKRLYVERKLIGGLDRLWYDMKRKLSLLILNHDFSSYRFDEFIRIIQVVDLMIHIGDEFYNRSSSTDIRDCINTQALNFFNAYHKSSMEELKMFLENELWEIVPVKSDFKLVHLREFSFLRAPNSMPPVKLSTYQVWQRQDSNNGQSFFNREIIKDEAIDLSRTNELEADKRGGQTLSVIPFEKLLRANEDTSEDLFKSDHGNSCGEPYQGYSDDLPMDRVSLSTDSDEDSNSELNQDYVEEEDFITSDEEITEREIPKRSDTNRKIETTSGLSGGSQGRYSLTGTSGPALTNSSLNTLRLFGRYIQMMSVLEPISYEILMRIYNLLDHYTMVVYRRFGPEIDKRSEDKNVSPKLKDVIRSIRASLIGTQHASSKVDDGSRSESPKKTDEVPNLNIRDEVQNIGSILSNELTDTHEPINPQKAVAIESLIYLVNQLWNLQGYLESLIPAELRPRLREEFTQNNSIVPDFLRARADMNSLSGSSFT